MPEVVPNQLATVDCLLQNAIERRNRNPRSKDVRASNNPGSLKLLTLTSLEFNYLALWNRPDQSGETTGRPLPSNTMELNEQPDVDCVALMDDLRPMALAADRNGRGVYRTWLV
jgi:hypothetical protein